MITQQNNTAALSELIQEVKHLKQLVATMAPKEFYSLEETRIILGMGRTKIYHLAKEGRLEVRKVGKKCFVTKDSIDKLVFGPNSKRVELYN